MAQGGRVEDATERSRQMEIARFLGGLGFSAAAVDLGDAAGGLPVRPALADA